MCAWYWSITYSHELSTLITSAASGPQYCYIALIFSAGEGIKQSISMAELIILTIVTVKIQPSDNMRRRKLHLYHWKFRYNTGYHCHERSTYSVRASAVVTSLLLQSGDVEQNPGPGQQSCKLIIFNFWCIIFAIIPTLNLWYSW